MLLCLRAWVTSAHLPGKSKLKVGQTVRGRVLERDAGAKKIIMTLKKSLVGSKLPAIAHLEVRHRLVPRAAWCHAPLRPRCGAGPLMPYRATQ